MKSQKRWEKAQAYEKRHWEKVAQQIASKAADDLDWYEWKANRLRQKFLNKVKDLDLKEKKILEVGSGPIGMVTFLEVGERYTLDPLEDFFKSNPVLSRLRNPKVKYMQGKGEELPFPDSFFALVIIDNVLDHTESPIDVLKETFRVLSPEGFLCLMVNVHTRLGLTVRSLVEIFQMDKGHPHSYTQISTRQLVESIGFEIYYEELEDREKARRKELRAGHFRNRLKAAFGISDIQYEVLAKRG